MKKILSTILSFSLLLIPTLANATTVIPQSQEIITPFQGVVMSTSTKNGGFLQASTSPTVNSITATSTTLTNYFGGLVKIVGTFSLTSLSDGCLTVTTGAVSSTGVACGSGSGSSFPFTQTSYGVSTSTTIGLLNGFLSTASSTVNSALRLPTLTAGSLYIGSGGLVNTVATSTLTGTGLISVTAGAYVDGAVPIVVSCSTCGAGTVTAVTGTYPVNSSGGTTPAISLAFGTTTSNTWAGTQTFTNAPILSSLTGVLLGNGSSAVSAGSTQTCTNQFFRSLSSSFAVTCSAVSLTADVSGILPLLNGGTATSTFYNGGVVFSDASKLTQSAVASNFFWSEPKGILALGTTTPGNDALLGTGGNLFELDNTTQAGLGMIAASTSPANRVVGQLAALSLSGATTGLYFGTLSNHPIIFYGNNNARIYMTGGGFWGQGTSTPYGETSISNIAGSPAFVIGSSTATTFIVDKTLNVGIGTTTPGTLLSIGNSGGINFVPTATSTFSSSANGIEIKNGCFSINLVCVGGSSLSTPVSIANGGTFATSFANTNGSIYYDGTRLVSNVNTAANTILVGNNAAPIFSASPTIGTSVTTPLVIGGTANSSSLSLQSTSGVGTTDFIKFLTGNNGGTEVARMTSGGLFGIGTTTPRFTLDIASTTKSQISLEGNPTDFPWNLRSIGNNLYFATSSPTTFATSTNAAVSFQDRPGFPAFSSVASTTPFSIGTFVRQFGSAPLFSVASSTVEGSNMPNFEINANGMPMYSGPKPTCDANCTFTAGNNARFRVTTGASITTTTVTFAGATPFGSTAPLCHAEEGSAGTVVATASSTTSTVIITLASALTSKDIEVWCDGIQ